ncbi:sugar transferase [Mycobacterium sp. RTGN5]|uniref:sugar transferase n=1 Tax=Mycobacterium sp. RTGN5 TaxID=3016522 RepID=UPI0029C8076D|nr:sugar transferase [Mycobacterium sp. RTGN5]
MKRAVDVVASAVLLMVTLPLMVLASAAIIAIDGWPVIFVQERDGLCGDPFRLLKLRTMYRDADTRLAALLADDDAAATEWNRYLRLRDDPRVLGRVGRTLRRWSIDELPQLVNVARGDMSLVGPRPMPTDLLHHLPPSFLNVRRAVKPGISGLWQVQGRSANDLVGLQQLDVRYVQKHSLRLDLYILARTPWAVLARRGAM